MLSPLIGQLLTDCCSVHITHLNALRRWLLL